MSTTDRLPSVPTTCPPDDLGPEERRRRTDVLLRELAGTRDDLRAKRLRDEVVRLNLDVVDAVVTRFRHRGLPADDVRQVACLGLVQAVRRFDPDAGHAFLSFAVPTIRGEVRRYFRDHSWTVRPPRPVQELQAAVTRESQRLAQRLGRPPTAEELAAALDVPTHHVREAMAADCCFTPVSLDTRFADSSHTLGDLLPVEDRDRHAVDARLILAPAVRELPWRDRELLRLRFFEGLTQRQIGERFGMSQMQVSRVLSRILGDLRTAIDGPSRDRRAPGVRQRGPGYPSFPPADHTPADTPDPQEP